MAICREQDGNTKIAETQLGKWSDWAIETFRIEGRDQRASVRFKLMELASDGTGLKLYRTQVTYTDGFTYPNDLAAELTEKFGPYQEHASMSPYTSGMADFDTALEECEYQGLWFAEVCPLIQILRGYASHLGPSFLCYESKIRMEKCARKKGNDA